MAGATSAKDSGGVVYPFLQRGYSPFHFVPGDGNQPHKLSQVCGLSGKPAAFGKAVYAARVVGESHVLQRRVGVDGSHPFGVAQGYYGLQFAPADYRFQVEALPGVPFEIGGRTAADFNSHRAVAWGGNQQVGPLAAGENVGRLGFNLRRPGHSLQNAGQIGVGDGFIH